MRTPLIALLLLPAGLAAQTTISLTAATPISVLTNEGSSVSFDTVPVNTTIGVWPNNVALSTSQTPTGKFLLASASIYPGLSNYGGIAFNYFLHAACRGVAGDYAGSSSSPAQAGATLGDNGVLATFAAGPGTTGNLRITLLANAGTTGTAFASVDVDNDGTAEFAQGTTGSLSIPYTFGPSGQVVVRVDNECQVPGVGLTVFNRAYSEVTVGFWPDLTATCNLTSYGQGCGGVQATGSEQITGTARTLSVQATGCFANDPVIVATGSQQLQLPLLGGCELLCNAEGVAIVPADAAGIATMSWSIPSTVLGTTHIQMLPITLVNGALVLKASNGVRVYCHL